MVAAHSAQEKTVEVGRLAVPQLKRPKWRSSKETLQTRVKETGDSQGFQPHPINADIRCAARAHWPLRRGQRQDEVRIRVRAGGLGFILFQSLGEKSCHCQCGTRPPLHAQEAIQILREERVKSGSLVPDSKTSSSSSVWVDSAESRKSPSGYLPG